MDSAEKILFLFLGWLLGLFSPLIVESIKRKRETDEVRRGILTELGELKLRLAGVVFVMAKRFWTLDRGVLTWAREIAKEYRGINPIEDLRTATEKLLELNDDQIRQLAQQSRPHPGSALSLKKYSLPFLDSKMSYLSTLDVSFQNHIFEIKNYLNALSEEVDQARLYTARTFDSSLSEENHGAVCQNVENCYKKVAELSRTIVEIICKLERGKNQESGAFF